MTRISRSGFPITLHLLCVLTSKPGQKGSKSGQKGHFLGHFLDPVLTGSAREHAKRGGVWPGADRNRVKTG